MKASTGMLVGRDHGRDQAGEAYPLLDHKRDHHDRSDPPESHGRDHHERSDPPESHGRDQTCFASMRVLVCKTWF